MHEKGEGKEPFAKNKVRKEYDIRGKKNELITLVKDTRWG